ncbi:MAG: hypothetical protein QMC97_10760 [Pseudothermotoga sp.]|uniref:hypothetical protein n=1 Tax=Pseudothermotoga sp. TaxID=2033661 RepID=UPI00258FC4FA|nr:hypothetical protein [Pseudothermotoga sp.]MDI6863846.1 hypothetical protein [Pseudothermotoga sp.]
MKRLAGIVMLVLLVAVTSFASELSMVIAMTENSVLQALLLQGMGKELVRY